MGVGDFARVLLLPIQGGDMKYIVLILLLNINAFAAQINLDCLNEDGNKVASIYTPTFVYSNFNLKLDLSTEEGLLSLDVPFNPSIEMPGVYFSSSDTITAIGIPEGPLFGQNAKMNLSIMENGILVKNLSCETTVNNPAFPRD